ncbi:PREDICTED: DUF21 domain-containing protein At1g47330 isoform X2 [Prunus mume]|uniref:DUF21 domain-containing protein At1g47330 isoform X2 n=1 Tax=Prunus mume TaxID=102107 RepID=A0ABM1LKQ1_PRUMU|nr:PREDICTED: DUF21 domain-containing protein At1g47330 isoform X2 [Prunus mume]
MAVEVICCGTKFWLYVLIIIGLVCFAGMMAGLTLGLMSLGLVDLEVLMKSGRPQDRKHAAKIYPVVKNQHLLLCTLLIGNALAMEALPVFLDSLVPPWAAIVISVTLILVFGEVLDWMLGKGHAALLRRAELKTFVDFHGNEAGKGGDLTHDETTIIAGALQLTEKTAKDAMTLISSAFSLDLDAPLTLETLNAIMTKGHSRVPVYAGNPKNIIGLVLVKNLLMIDPEDAVTLRKMMIRRIPRVSEDIPLYDILNEFQKGHSHIAVVYKDLNGRKEALKNGKEGETSVFKDDCKMQGGQSEASLKKDGKVGSNNAQIATDNGDGGQQNKKIPPATPAFKKRHRGCSHCILDIENTPIPVFPDNEEVVGVITMEDVIEELLQEEILDETDEYVNIHNRIKVNMHASQEKDFHLNSPELPEGSSATPTITSSVPTDSGSTQHQDSAKVATIGPMPTSSHTPTHQGSEGDMSRDR